MRYELHLKEGGVIDIPDGVPFFAAVIGQGGLELQVHGNYEALFGALCKLITVLFARKPPMEIAASLGTIRNSLKARGVLPENVDMAVAMDGHILPLDDILMEATETWGREEHE